MDEKASKDQASCAQTEQFSIKNYFRARGGTIVTAIRPHTISHLTQTLTQIPTPRIRERKKEKLNYNIDFTFHNRFVHFQNARCINVRIVAQINITQVY